MNKAVDMFHKNCIRIYVRKSPIIKDIYYLEVDDIKDIILVEDSKFMIDTVFTHMKKNVSKYTDIMSKILFTSITIFINDIEIDYSQITVFFNMSKDCAIINN